jgi:lambda family phage portal protein
MMKISFEFGRSAPPASPPRPTGAQLIRASVVQPHHAQVLRDVNRRMLRMYEAAVTDRLNADFPVSLASANAEILASAIAARSRSRRLERDNPYAWGILNEFQNNVVGDDPFRLQMKVGQRTPEGEFIEERATNQQIEEWWTEAGRPENFTVRRDMSRLEAYLQALSALVRDGGILWRKWRAFPHNRFGYAVQPIEVDRLDHHLNQTARGSGNRIRFGIEMDEFEAPLAFHIWESHPGDVFGFLSSSRVSERVKGEEIIALWDIRTRAGQYIGMPRFSSIIQRLHRMDQYDVAEITAAIWASCKPFFLTRTNASGEYSGDEASRAGETISAVEPATGEILPEGYKPELVDPKHPTEAYPHFCKANLRAVGRGSGLAYHTLANDLEGVNFSSGRLGENAQRDEFKKLQAHMITGLVYPDFRERLRYAILSGNLPGLSLARLDEFCRAAHFTGKRWPYVNPLQDAQADVLRVENGLDSRQRIVAESDRGGTFADVCAEQAADEESAELHGLEFGERTAAPAVAELEPGEVEEPTAPKPASKPGSKQTLSKARSRAQLDRTLRVLAVTGDPQRNGHH